MRIEKEDGYNNVTATAACLEERHGGPVQQGGEDEPRAHHPPQISRPRQQVPLPQVHVRPRVNRAPQRRRMRPRDGLWLAC